MKSCNQVEVPEVRHSRALQVAGRPCYGGGGPGRLQQLVRYVPTVWASWRPTLRGWQHFGTAYAVPFFETWLRSLHLKRIVCSAKRTLQFQTIRFVDLAIIRQLSQQVEGEATGTLGTARRAGRGLLLAR